MIERQGSTNAGPPESTQTDFLLKRNPPTPVLPEEEEKDSQKAVYATQKNWNKYIAFLSLDVVKKFCI